MSARLYIVNAFTANGKNGNPAGVMLNADGLDEQEMLTIAAKVGLSETAFVSKSNHATYRVRFFTPTVEEPLCGHATIATWYLLSKLGEIRAGTYTQETNAGILKVSAQQDGLTFMEQATAEFFDDIEVMHVNTLLGLDLSDFHTKFQPRIVSTGIKDLLIPVSHKSVLLKLRPNLENIAEFSRAHDICGFHVFALLGKGQSIASARNFAPADGISEECATGTSNGALLCYMRNVGLLPEQAVYRVEQGETMGRLSYVYGMFKDDTVWIGGEAQIVGERDTTLLFKPI
jgi:PhzF family phenazine biosynthesis protein